MPRENRSRKRLRPTTPCHAGERPGCPATGATGFHRVFVLLFFRGGLRKGVPGVARRFLCAGVPGHFRLWERDGRIGTQTALSLPHLGFSNCLAVTCCRTGLNQCGHACDCTGGCSLDVGATSYVLAIARGACAVFHCCAGPPALRRLGRRHPRRPTAPARAIAPAAAPATPRA
jgi:hypothetical protein